MPYQHLNAAERQVIQRAREAGEPFSAIAKTLGRNPSTISREWRRNCRSGRYEAGVAQQHADARARIPRHQARYDNRRLRSVVLAGLAREWSPEIISARLALDFPKAAMMRVSPETIYQWVYRDTTLGGQLHRNLWQRRPRRRRRRDRLPAHSRIANRVDISERPQIVDRRARVGDWEGDMVVSRKNRGGLVTHLERVTRFLVAGRAKNKQAATFTAVTQQLFGWVPKSLCQTLTLDNGTENAGHECISQDKDMAVYFAHPHAPWQRGANEQANGLIRRYFPKGTDFRKVTDAQIEEMVMKINQRPRKCLHYQSPYDVFAEALRRALAT